MIAECAADNAEIRGCAIYLVSGMWCDFPMRICRKSLQRERIVRDQIRCGNSQELAKDIFKK